LAETRYSSGLGSPIEITDALVAADNAQIANVQAVFDYNVALAQLRRAMGQPLL
jgi:outer membrane protein TolC